MMGLPELIVVDVGHGSCALLRDIHGTVIIDCGTGSTLVDTLDYLHVRDISSILISHADQDHIGGIIALLSKRELKVQHGF
jgi:beta-lactamase superfamily II metal-dependent hydrolase